MRKTELRIRRFEERDLPALSRLLADGEVMRWLEPPFTPERAEAFLKSAGLCDPPRIWAVEDGDRRFAGYVIYHDYEEDSREIGWVLDRSFWGKGCASRLTEMLTAWARSEGKSAVIECAPEQRATKRIAEKYGFVFAGKRGDCDVWRLDMTGRKEEMEYRRIEASEAEKLWELHKAYKAEIGEEEPGEREFERLKKAIEEGRITFYGAWDGETLAGCCSVTVGFSTFDYAPSGVFEDFYIRPEYRHRGAARQLVLLAYRDSGVGTMTVGCADCDRAMYGALGFTAPLGNLLAFE